MMEELQEPKEKESVNSDSSDTALAMLLITTPHEAATEFELLIANIVRELTKNEKENLEAVKTICFSLTIKGDPGISLFNKEQQAAIAACDSLRTMFTKTLCKFWRWDDFSLLEKLVQSLESFDQCEVMLKHYEQKLDSLMKLQDMQEYCMQEKKEIPKGYDKMVVAVRDKTFSQIIRKDYDEFKKFISQQCGVEPYVILPLNKVDCSSLALDFIVPAIAIPHMMESVSKNSGVLIKKAIVYLRISSTVLFDIRNDSEHWCTRMIDVSSAMEMLKLLQDDEQGRHIESKANIQGSSDPTASQIATIDSAVIQIAYHSSELQKKFTKLEEAIAANALDENTKLLLKKYLGHFDKVAQWETFSESQLTGAPTVASTDPETCCEDILIAPEEESQSDNMTFKDRIVQVFYKPHRIRRPSLISQLSTKDGGNDINISKLTVNMINDYGQEKNQFKYPYQLANGPNNELFVSDRENHHLVIFNDRLQYLGVFGKQGTGKGEFYNPTGLAVDVSNGFLFVADYNNIIQKFKITSDGESSCQLEYVSHYGEKGREKGQLHCPSGLAFCSKGLFVCDFRNHRVQVFTGNEVYAFGHHGTDLGEFNEPHSIAINKDENKVFITDHSNNRIQVFTPEGGFVGIIVDDTNSPNHPQLQYPRGIFCTCNGHLLVSCTHTDCIVEFSEDGDYISTIENIIQPGGIVMQHTGEIVVICNIKQALYIITSQNDN